MPRTQALGARKSCWQQDQIRLASRVDDRLQLLILLSLFLYTERCFVLRAYEGRPETSRVRHVGDEMSDAGTKVRVCAKAEVAEDSVIRVETGSRN